ncbi:MAG: hypothetical protein RIB45_11925 [Marivibrio sp.]|uniref:hypothetical protein n=1 Tax=Marivibrio sp. TaxID=2039719 RepID=UPI0032EB93D8
MLLGSGRFLCFDVRQPFQDLKVKAAADRDQADTNAPEQSGVPGTLFDLSTLNLGIFFKEVGAAQDDDDDVGVTTRIFFPYNDEDILEGGESTSADPKEIFEILSKRGAVKPGEQFTPHDQKVLEVLSTLPTFDPFLLLSRRRELESDRSVNGAYFEISEADWARIRKPVMSRISMLVSKANQGSAVDVYQQYVNGGQQSGEDEAARMMTSAVVDSIWRGEATQGARQLIRSFRLEEAETAQILFAWKGINYYEYQYQSYEVKLRSFYRWLGSTDSMPKDATGMESSAIDRFTYRRDKARKLIRATHAKITSILIEYNQAFDALIDEDSPGRFQEFLRTAPQSFITVGLSIGVLAHTANAWAELTSDGRKPLQKASVLEPFYDFIIAVNGQDYSMERAS